MAVVKTINAKGYAHLLANEMVAFEGPATEMDISTPSICPCCEQALATDILPIISVNNLVPPPDTNMEGDYVQCDPNGDCDVMSVYRCTACNSLFVRHCNRSVRRDEFGILHRDLVFVQSYPCSNGETSFPDAIQTLSSDFVEIYNQTEHAEAAGLTRICGAGYRRALEFLVDEYVRKLNRGVNIDADMALSAKISKYIHEPKIQEFATKSAWLGNDETHIVNWHPDRNILCDMKKFIHAIVHLIEIDELLPDAQSIKPKSHT